MKRAHRLRLSFLLAAALSAWAQDGTPAAKDLEARVDAYVQPLVETRNFSGVIFIARGGKVLFQKAYGMADAELRVPNSLETRFHLASVSKPFTAAAILLLEERGRLSVQDPVSKYVPDYPSGDRIRIHHLLTHSSGIPNINNFPEFAKLSQFPQTTAQLVEVFKNKPLDFQPGEKFAYSNSNYNLLAFIIEKASGQPYGDFLEKNIFAPLGMIHTFHHGDISMLILDRASGYAPAGFDGLVNAPILDWSAKTGNGSLVSTVGDLYNFDRALYGDKLLSSTSRAKIFKDYGWGVGYGWFVRKGLGRNLITANGRSPGFTSNFDRFVDDDVCIILLANIYSSITQTMAGDVAAIVFGQEGSSRPLRAPSAVAPALLQAYSGRYRFGADFVFNPGVEVSIEVADGHLVMRGGTGESFLLPQSETEFVDRLYGGRVTFVRDAAGRVTGLKWNFGREYSAQRVETK